VQNRGNTKYLRSENLTIEMLCFFSKNRDLGKVASRITRWLRVCIAQVEKFACGHFKLKNLALEKHTSDF